jgi:hypothetical protein
MKIHIILLGLVLCLPSVAVDKKPLTQTEIIEAAIRKSLKEVAKCGKLKVFRCEGTKITIAGVVQLQKALPKCKILHDFE